MARMVPFPMLETESAAERRLYEGFLEQLDEAFVVYHSVDWVLGGRDGPVQGEADFVISHPEHGVLALEAKGGAITYDPGTRRWAQSGHSGTHVLREDPFHQAADEMHSLVEILRARPGWERWKPSYGFGVAFPDGRYDDDAHPGAPAAVAIDRDDMDRLGARVIEVMRHWGREGRRFGAEGMDALGHALGFRVEIRAPLKLAFNEEDRRIVELTEQQAWVRAFVLNRRRAAVSGPAGSGKTLLAVGIATRLADEGRRTLLTCFNRLLADDLRERTTGHQGLDVAHFHGLCMSLAKEAGLPLPESPASSEPDSSYFEHELPGLLEEAARRLGARYEAIVVDEAQDFREWWWPALLALHNEPDEGRLYLFYDDNQNLYGGQLPVENVDLCPLPLNVRNTKAIASFVSVFYDGIEEPQALGPEGRPPQILGYEDDEGLVRLLAIVLKNLVESEEVPLDDIVVLTPSGKAKSRLRARERIDGFRLSERPEPGAILATSIHGFKGLEREVVILAELGDKHLEDLRRYLYVGASRAKNELVVLALEPVARELRRIAGVTGP